MDRGLALVTGGAVRVGRAISIGLANAGYRVVVHANSHFEEAQRLAKKLDGFAVSGDLSNPNSRTTIFQQVDGFEGRLSLLVNSAAVFRPSAPEDVDPTLWTQHVDVNLSAPFFCAQQAYQRMRTSGGSIINIVDIAALQPEENFVHYAMTKAGLLSMTRGLAHHWAPKVRVNGVSPGPVLLPETYTPAERAAWLERLPMGEALGPKDVADTVTFLATGPSGITGQVIRVDGGWTSRVS